MDNINFKPEGFNIRQGDHPLKTDQETEEVLTQRHFFRSTISKRPSAVTWVFWNLVLIFRVALFFQSLDNKPYYFHILAKNSGLRITADQIAKILEFFVRSREDFVSTRSEHEKTDTANRSLIVRLVDRYIFSKPIISNKTDKAFEDVLCDEWCYHLAENRDCIRFESSASWPKAPVPSSCKTKPEENPFMPPMLGWDNLTSNSKESPLQKTNLKVPSTAFPSPDGSFYGHGNRRSPLATVTPPVMHPDNGSGRQSPTLTPVVARRNLETPWPMHSSPTIIATSSNKRRRTSPKLQSLSSPAPNSAKEILHRDEKISWLEKSLKDKEEMLAMKNTLLADKEVQIQMLKEKLAGGTK